MKQAVSSQRVLDILSTQYKFSPAVVQKCVYMLTQRGDFDYRHKRSQLLRLR